MSNPPEPYFPDQAAFSRQEVHERTGVPDDVLAFWIKQDLITPLPARPKAHRRFSFEQLHVAAVLHALRSLGANVKTLRAFAAALQLGIKIRRAANFSDTELRSVVSLSRQLYRFGRGGQVEIFDPLGDFRRGEPAQSEEEIIDNWMHFERNEGASTSTAQLAQSLKEDEAYYVGWAAELLSESHLTRGGSQWIAWLDSETSARFAHTNECLLEEDNGPTAAFYIPISRLVQRLWPERIQPAKKRFEIERLEHLSRHADEIEEANPLEAKRIRQNHGLITSNIVSKA